MEEFNKNGSTIQRDISYIEKILPNEASVDRSEKGNYQLRNLNGINNFEKLTDTEILILLQILASTRIFNKKEQLELSNKLVQMADKKESFQQFIGNEQLYYQGISFGDLIPRIELITQAIIKHQCLEFSYKKNGEVETFQRIPNGIYYSDLYFYVLSSSHMAQDDTDLSAMNKFRIHSMEDLKIVSSHNRTEHKDKFEGGQLRSQTVLPFLGNPITVELDFYYDPMYVFDRFPNHQFIKTNEDGSHRIKIQGNDGYGMKMWLLSQSHMVKVISPKHIRDYVIKSMTDTLSFYDIQTSEK
jgi:predicted DNA-binding transcriptional regulator YafY